MASQVEGLLSSKDNTEELFSGLSTPKFNNETLGTNFGPKTIQVKAFFSKA